MLAAKGGFYDCVDLLLSDARLQTGGGGGGGRLEVDATDYEGHTAAMWAAWNGHDQILQRLLHAKARSRLTFSCVHVRSSPRKSVWTHISLVPFLAASTKRTPTVAPRRWALPNGATTTASTR